MESVQVAVSETEETVHAIPVEEPLHSADAVPSRFAQLAFQASQQVGEDVADQGAEFPLDGDTEFEEETFGVEETDVRQHIKTLSEDWNTRIYDEHTGLSLLLRRRMHMT